MRKSINATHQRQPGETITAVYINVNGHFKRKNKKSEVEVGMVDNKKFALY